MLKLLLGATFVIPKSFSTLGLLFHVVAKFAFPCSFAKSRSPVPPRVYEDVLRSVSFGKKNNKEHVEPAYEAGMSKTKMEDVVGVMFPKYDVPDALSGLMLETGKISCGY